MHRSLWACAALVLILSVACGAAPALSWSEGTGFRAAPTPVPAASKPGFTLMNSQTTGLRFTNELRGDLLLTNAVALNGAGVALGDVDGDGLPDIYLCNLHGPNRLYHNLGDWKFEEMEIGEAACLGQISSGATFADVDGDGDLDLLVNGIAAGTRLFLNDGKGHWTEMQDSGLSRTASATSMALADIDGDGDLDLYCAHYIDVMHLADPTTVFALERRGDTWEVTKVNGASAKSPRLKGRFEALPDGKVRELPEYQGLYRNDGHGHFTPIQFEPGVFQDEQGKPMPPPRDWGLAAMFRDLNGDGAPDIYLCNDNVSPDRIWINSGKGTFRAIEATHFRHTSRSSMGVDFADINRDGYDDLVVVDMLARDPLKRMTQLVTDRPTLADREGVDSRPAYNRNTFFYGRPDGSFAEAALMAGVAATDWTWCPVFLDVDLDGYEDLLVTNGFEFDVLDQDSNDELKNPTRRLTRDQRKRSRQFHPHWPSPNAAFRNRRDGTFAPAGAEWGFDQTGVSYGMAMADLDNDGDLDLVVNNLNGEASLYRNNASGGRIQVRLRGTAPNTQGVGAKLRLVGGAVTQTQEMICGGRYLSGDQALRVFAADPQSAAPLTLEVKWRNGGQSAIPVRANQIYEVREESSSTRPTEKPAARPQPLFADVSALLGHKHQENAFDDYARQPLLPRRFSQLGPGMAWFDLDGDGWEDLVIGGAHGGKLALFKNEQGKAFRPVEASQQAADHAAVLGWPDGQGKRKLLAALSSYEMAPGQESQVEVYSPDNLAAPLRLPAGLASIGPMALADIDGDGDLDLFVGGQLRPGRYPEAVDSAIWLNNGGQLERSAQASQPFAGLGLVNAATFADLDGDGRPDLALALDWGGVRVFRNLGGRFEEMTNGLAGRNGWWTSIAAGDFDGDGRLDLVVGNWGRNSAYELALPSNLRVYHDDWNATGSLGLLEAAQRGQDWFPLRNRLALAPGLPDLQAQFPTHQAFAKATIADILGPRLAKAGVLEANELRSGLLLNRGSKFEWAPLPAEAQMTPVFSINVGDFDADGIEDIFLGQNFFGTASDLSREDAGRGLWLRGIGDGTFAAVDGDVTGVKIYGEQRGAALADFNHDGRVDLAVSQNNGASKLYLNQSPKRGLRVALKGPPGNPDAVGASLRVVYEGGRVGPARAVQAGSGYWSQDAAAQVLGLAGAPSGVRVRWPGGREQTFPLDKNAWDLHFEPTSEAK